MRLVVVVPPPGHIGISQVYEVPPPQVLGVSIQESHIPPPAVPPGDGLNDRITRRQTVHNLIERFANKRPP